MLKDSTFVKSIKSIFNSIFNPILIIVLFGVTVSLGIIGWFTGPEHIVYCPATVEVLAGDENSHKENTWYTVHLSVPEDCWLELETYLVYSDKKTYRLGVYYKDTNWFGHEIVCNDNTMINDIKDFRNFKIKK